MTDFIECPNCHADRSMKLFAVNFCQVHLTEHEIWICICGATYIKEHSDA